MIFICVAAFTAHALLGTSWSNRCDPGNERLNVLRSDPVVPFRASGELFSTQNVGADNSWLCTGPDVSVDHYCDPAALYTQLRAKFMQSGWTDDGTPYDRSGVFTPRIRPVAILDRKSEAFASPALFAGTGFPLRCI